MRNEKDVKKAFEKEKTTFWNKLLEDLGLSYEEETFFYDDCCEEYVVSCKLVSEDKNRTRRLLEERFPLLDEEGSDENRDDLVWTGEALYKNSDPLGLHLWDAPLGFYLLNASH